MRIFIRFLFYEYLMVFEQDTSFKRFGEKAGFLFAYFFLTTVLFLILTFLNKIPVSWSYFHIMGVTFLITLFGILTRRFLK